MPPMLAGSAWRGATRFPSAAAATRKQRLCSGTARSTASPTGASYTQDNYTLTMAPRIANGKVIIGAAGAEFPVRGFIAGFDAETGRFAWRFYTVPGDPSKGFENDAMKK